MTLSYDYILVVDDNKSICRLLFEILTDEGYMVEISYNGKEALAKIANRTPALIFLDVKMPAMNGFETLAEISKLNPTVPVVIMTAYSELKMVKDAERRGLVKYYLKKPFDLDELRRLTKTLFFCGNSREKERTREG